MAADVLQARSTASAETPRHFIGYGGAKLFGRIPHYTESRFTKYYKGILGQLFGDLGPFTTGMLLAILGKMVKSPFRKKTRWRILADGQPVAEDVYQAIIVVNGYLGPDMPFSNQPLGSGEFYCFGLRDIGGGRLPAQAKHARDGSIMEDPGRWGLVSISVKEKLELVPDHDKPFPVNVDGGTFIARQSMVFERTGQIPLIAN